MEELNQLKTGSDLEKAFKLWSGKIFGYIFARVKNQLLAEDLVQEIFTKAWNHKSKFDPNKSALKSWLFTITANHLRDHFRRKDIEISELTEEFGAEDTITHDLHLKERIEFIMKKMKMLSDREQELLLLRYQSDLSIEEVAQVMKMEYSATKVAIHRALKRLKSFCH